MQNFDTALGESEAPADDRENIRQRVWDFLVYLFKRFVVFVSFGTGILGFLWLLGRIFRR